MSPYSMHHNKILFPKSHSFDAIRCLDNPRAPSFQRHDGTTSSGAKKLASYMISFGGGTRECAGKTFSNAIIYLALASLVKNCSFSGLDTEYKDVGFMRDHAIPCPAADSKGMRVLVC
jgi:cytochrome P450